MRIVVGEAPNTYRHTSESANLSQMDDFDVSTLNNRGLNKDLVLEYMRTVMYVSTLPSRCNIKYVGQKYKTFLKGIYEFGITTKNCFLKEIFLKGKAL